MLITSQLYTYYGKGWMYCISGGTSCSFPGRLIYEGCYCWMAKEKRTNSGFGLKVMLGGYIYISVHYTLQLSCETVYKIS